MCLPGKSHIKLLHRKGNTWFLIEGFLFLGGLEKQQTDVLTTMKVAPVNIYTVLQLLGLLIKC